MTTKSDGGPAFPVWELNGDGQPEMTCFGISVRDYFAAKAMQGWLSSYGPDDQHPANNGSCDFVAAQAYAMADAMLAERNKS
ncbi:hypothetical protein [Candidimonas nitroreducens]|uniref:Uncharacterized protein n=1 Tax=Candidimonas nitroreducens TaxID=683354 RepID=A0A225MKT8_9BURK|nr:hypothetical protein [Candidimonas nitroreducens]OWT61987.1 hypothetical protein CEY11_09255 [Candidimonas nitroreducens]